MSSKAQRRRQEAEDREALMAAQLVTIAKHVRTIDELEQILDAEQLDPVVREAVKARILDAAPHLRVM